MELRPAIHLAQSDCRTCNRRRIRCDRREPYCTKCSKKGLVCPGYKQPLRWANAIAVRGRFRGLSAPDTSQAGVLRRHSTRSGSSSAQTTSASSTGDGIATLKRFTQPVVKRLLDYYEASMTPIMTWIDSPLNGWRLFILPLAASQPILQLSILASAAAHAPFSTGVDEELLLSASETAVTMITSRLTQLNKQDPYDGFQYDIKSIEILAIIAAVLVLSDYALIRSDLSVAQFHREGIRTLLNTLPCTSSHETEILFFLKDEAAAYDVLACTFLFDIHRIRNAILPSTQGGVFAHFLCIIHRISIHSLQSSGSGRTDDCDPKECPSSITELENQFEAARGATLLSAGPLLESVSDTLKGDFIFLVAAYHHAGLLYAHKRFVSIKMEQKTHDYHLERLFRALECINDISTVLGGLTWPLFIAGICSSTVTDQMQKVDSWCQLLATHTRYEHYKQLTKFLRELHHRPQDDWIVLAKQYESQGEPIAPI